MLLETREVALHTWDELWSAFLRAEMSNITTQPFSALLKADVEGAELLVLKGATGFIRRYQPVIFLELLRKWCANFEYHPNDVINHLKKFGYTCFALEKEISPVSSISSSDEATNFLFLPENSASIKQLLDLTHFANV